MSRDRMGSRRQGNRPPTLETSPSSSTAETESKVGYGKPPIHSRFQSGRSGNPRGRPKQSRNLKTSIQQALIETIVVREAGKKRHIKKLVGIVMRQIEKALLGDDRAALATFKIASQVGLFDQSEAAQPDLLTPAEQVILQEFLGRFPSKDDEPGTAPCEPT